MLNVDLIVTPDNHILFILEGVDDRRVERVEYYSGDGRVQLTFDDRGAEALDNPIADDLRVAFRQREKVRIGHVTDSGSILSEYIVPLVSRRTSLQPG